MAKRGQGEGTISKRADGTWWARITVGKTADGKQKRKAFYGKTRKEVQEKLTAALNELNNNTYIEPSKMTVAQWMEIWRHDYKQQSVKPTTFYNYQKKIKFQINPYLGGYKLKELRSDMIQKSLNQLIENGLAIISTQHTLDVLRLALKKAVENELILKNPSLNVSLPKPQKKEMVVLTEEQQEKLIEVCKQRYSGKIFILILATGMRIGEVTALRWSDIDFEEGELHVKRTRREYYIYSDNNSEEREHFIDFGTPKTPTSKRTIPLLPDIIVMLKEMKEEHDALKVKFGKSYNDENLVFCTR